MKRSVRPSLDAEHFRAGPMNVPYGESVRLRRATAHVMPANVQELLVSKTFFTS